MTIDQNRQGNLFVVAGPSGVGKGTVIGALLKKVAGIKKSVSATTRQPRPGERNGIDYFFKSQPQFQQMIKEHHLMEWAQFADNFYGTPLNWVADELDSGTDVILEIDIQGAKQIHQHYPQTTLIFLSPPSLSALENRLKNRATETAEKLAWRLNKAKEEMEQRHIFQYEIVNDSVEEAVNKLADIVYAKRVGRDCSSEPVSNE